MAFGVGVGDVLAVSKLARSTWKKFQDSSDQFKALRTEAANLCLVLDDIAQTVPGRELREKEALTLSSLTHGCYEILADMNKILQKYERLDKPSSSSVARTQKAWRKIRWDQDEVNELRSRVTSSTVSLDAFNSSLASKTSQAVKDNLTELAKRQDRQELQAIIDWLSPFKFPAQQSDIISRRHKGTGQWLLRSDQFRTWLNTARKTLFCSGIPGSGKTMLAAIAIDHLRKTVRRVDIGVVYIYCNYKMQLEQTTVNLVASLLKQLLQQQDIVSDDVKSFYGRHLKNGTRPTLEEVFKLLQSEMHRYSQIFVVIDALDECSIENQARRNLLSKLHALQMSHSVNLMMTSRHIPDITQEFQNSLQLEIRANEEDVRGYLDGQMFRLASCVRKNTDLQEAIKESIVKAVDGMFLLAQLHLDSLIDKPSPKAIKNALLKLPLGSNALGQAYDQALKRIDDQEPGFRQLADQVLAWITHAQRPLTIVELQHALAIEEGEPQLDHENIIEVAELISVCVGLVTIDQESGIIRLVHYTTQEYFRRIRLQRFPTAQKDIAAACLTYLSFDAFAEKLDVAEVDYDTSRHVDTCLLQHPFLKYAVQHWSDHARGDVEKEVVDLAETFLMNKQKVLLCCQVLRWYVPENSCLGDVFAWVWEVTNISAVHLTALFGLEHTTSFLLEKGLEADSRYGNDRSPLSWASQLGHEAVVKSLLMRRPEIDSGTRTPLSYAAGAGHEAVVELLLTREAQVDSKSNYDRTPLSFAAQRGHQAVVKLLLARGAAINSRDDYGRTPLSYAAEKGYPAVVELLLTRGAVVDLTVGLDQTLSLHTAEAENQAVVELLLARGAVEGLKVGWNRTPLSYATEHGHQAVVELLLTQGAAINLRDDDNQTPLSYAAKHRHQALVKLLLARGAKIDSRDYYDRTPLSYAAKKGHSAVVELLLARGAAIDSRSDYGQTPLSFAAEKGHSAVVELLLARGAAIDSRSDYGQTPLSFAAEKGHSAVVELLLARVATIDSRSNYGRTPLSYVAEKGHSAVVELLLARGAAVDSKDIYERTPLSYAAQEGHQAVVELLLTRDAEVDSKDGYDRTPLIYATQQGHQAVVKLLVSAQTIQVESKDC